MRSREHIDKCVTDLIGVRVAQPDAMARVTAEEDSPQTRGIARSEQRSRVFLAQREYDEARGVTDAHVRAERPHPSIHRAVSRRSARRCRGTPIRRPESRGSEQLAWRSPTPGSPLGPRTPEWGHGT